MVTVKDLEDLATTLNLPVYDLLLAGDGSGTVLDKPGGASCVLYDRKNSQLQIYKCAFSNATNNFSELIPYVHTLWAYEYKANRERRFWNYNYKVEVVTDSELTAKQGNREYSRNANRMLWAAIDWFNNNGYTLHWNWVARNSNPVSTACDEQSGKMRKLMMTALDSNRCVS